MNEIIDCILRDILFLNGSYQSITSCENLLIFKSTTNKPKIKGIASFYE